MDFTQFYIISIVSIIFHSFLLFNSGITPYILKESDLNMQYNVYFEFPFLLEVNNKLNINNLKYEKADQEIHQIT